MKKLAGIFFISFLICASCTENTPLYEVPETYDFANVDYSGQTQRLDMLAEIKSYLEGVVAGTPAMDTRLLDMYDNGPLADWDGTYESSKQLRGKTLSAVQDDFEQLMMKASSDSWLFWQTASEGQAGIITSLDGTKSYFVDANGFEYAQAIEKGLMGACFYYQATSVYFGNEKMSQDNTTVTEGRGTEMEHAWDEAFGYLGVEKDFPSNDEVRFWGKYINSRDGLLGVSQRMMDNFLAGRTAIINKDLTLRDQKISSIRKDWELVAATTAIHYINNAIANYNDPAIRFHALTEAAAFVYALQFNEGRTIDVNYVNARLIEIGGGDFLNQNYYNTTIDDLKAAKDALAVTFSVEDLKDQF